MELEEQYFLIKQQEKKSNYFPTQLILTSETAKFWLGGKYFYLRSVRLIFFFCY